MLTRADGEFDTGHLVVKVRPRPAGRAGADALAWRCPKISRHQQGGAALSCGLSTTPRTRGTTVVLRAFMHNQPVRRAALLAECVAHCCAALHLAHAPLRAAAYRLR